jgi:hypothetical protein
MKSDNRAFAEIGRDELQSGFYQENVDALAVAIEALEENEKLKKEVK